MALSIYPHGALTLVFSILCIVSSLAHAQTVTVSADDSRISYTGDWVDQDNGGHKFAGDTGCSMSFSFQGSAVSYHSVHNFNGGVARLSVDGDGVTEVDESSGTTKGADPVQAVLYSRQGLDASKTHTLNLQWVGPGSFGGGYVELYSLEYTPGGTTASNSPSAQASPQTTTKVATTTAEGQTVTATATATGAGQTVTQVSSQPNGASQNSATSLFTVTTGGRTVTGTVSSAQPSATGTTPLSVLTSLGAGQTVTATATGAGQTVTLSGQTIAPSAAQSTGGASSSKSASHTGAIIGGVVGGLLVLLILLGLLWCLWRRRKRQRARSNVAEPFMVQNAGSSAAIVTRSNDIPPSSPSTSSYIPNPFINRSDYSSTSVSRHLQSTDGSRTSHDHGYPPTQHVFHANHAGSPHTLSNVAESGSPFSLTHQGSEQNPAEASMEASLDHLSQFQARPAATLSSNQSDISFSDPPPRYSGPPRTTAAASSSTSRHYSDPSITSPLGPGPPSAFYLSSFSLDNKGL